MTRVGGTRLAEQARADGARGADDQDTSPLDSDSGNLHAVVLRTTNAAPESMNARVQRIKRMTCGYRNRERFRNAILFQLGGLDLIPRLDSTHTIS